LQGGERHEGEEAGPNPGLNVGGEARWREIFAATRNGQIRTVVALLFQYQEAKKGGEDAYNETILRRKKSPGAGRRKREKHPRRRMKKEILFRRKGRRRGNFKIVSLVGEGKKQKRNADIGGANLRNTSAILILRFATRGGGIR